MLDDLIGPAPGAEELAARADRSKGIDNATPQMDVIERWGALLDVLLIVAGTMLCV